MNQPEKKYSYASDADLALHFGINRATVWKWVRDYGFPAPVKLSPQMSRWKWADIEAWETSKSKTNAA